MKYYYEVAGHAFSVEVPESTSILDEMGQYAPFSIPSAEQVIFQVKVVDAAEFPPIEDVTVEMNQDDDGSQILAGRANGLPYFEFQLWGRCAARMLTDATYHNAIVVLVDEPLFGINNALMVMYALATASLQTALFHSSVVSLEGYGYMFLGKSGTGKSTHSSLWLKHIEGTALVNDDNPVVRRMPDGHVCTITTGGHGGPFWTCGFSRTAIGFNSPELNLGRRFPRSSTTALPRRTSGAGLPGNWKRLRFRVGKSPMSQAKALRS